MSGEQSYRAKLYAQIAKRIDRKRQEIKVLEGVLATLRQEGTDAEVEQIAPPAAPEMAAPELDEPEPPRMRDRRSDKPRDGEPYERFVDKCKAYILEHGPQTTAFLQKQFNYGPAACSMLSNSGMFVSRLSRIESDPKGTRRWHVKGKEVPAESPAPPPVATSEPFPPPAPTVDREYAASAEQKVLVCLEVGGPQSIGSICRNTYLSQRIVTAVVQGCDRIIQVPNDQYALTAQVGSR